MRIRPSFPADPVFNRVLYPGKKSTVTRMKIWFFSIIPLLLVALAAPPALAFTADRLVLAIDTAGDADLTFDYTLSWPEKVVYFVVPGKEEIVTGAIGSRYPKVTVSDVVVGADRSSLTLEQFASVSEGVAGTTYRTPAVSFAVAGDMLADYPDIARFILPDFSPSVTIIALPDGKEFRYDDVDAIPAIMYTVPT